MTGFKRRRNLLNELVMSIYCKNERANTLKNTGGFEMNETLISLTEKYGTEVIIARILEQLKLLAHSEDKEVVQAVKELITSAGCDTEYIYTLCEYTNLATFVSDNIQVTDSSWKNKNDI